VLDESSQAATNPALEAEKQWAPQAFARAAQLQEQAEDAFAAGHDAESQALAEAALGALQRAVALARLARAEQRAQSAQFELANLRKSRDELHASQTDLAAQADALELEYKVVRDAEPLEALTPADPGREAARRSLAVSVIEQARLLCLAARLTDAAAPVADSEKALDELEANLATNPKPTPVNRAVELRSDCLRALSELRRSRSLADPTSDASDVLMTELARALPKHPPFRDDRGVVVSIDNAFDAKGARPETDETLHSLTEIAHAHPQFGVLVVSHTRRGRSLDAPAKDALERWQTSANLPRLMLRDAGDRLPATILPVRGAPPADPRVEFVFVAP
jgi:hypothetical protein